MSEIKQILEELLEGEVPRLESRIEEWEKDYDAMRQSYEGQVRNTLAFKAENEKLRAEVKKADDARLALIKKVNHLRDWQRRVKQDLREAGQNDELGRATKDGKLAALIAEAKEKT